ncbi:unnamed protein product, partial [Polarella glacialis]
QVLQMQQVQQAVSILAQLFEGGAAANSDNSNNNNNSSNNNNNITKTSSKHSSSSDYLPLSILPLAPSPPSA